MSNFLEFYEEIQKPKPPEKEDDPELRYIELYWHKNHDLERSKKGKLEKITDKAELFPQMDVHAIGKNDRKGCPLDNHANCPENDNYSIELTPLNELAHLHIKVNPEIEYEKMTLVAYPSLYQVINSVFYELTFMGYTPKERDEKMEEILDSKKEVEDQILIEEGTRIVKKLFDENIEE